MIVLCHAPLQKNKILFPDEDKGIIDKGIIFVEKFGFVNNAG